MISCHNTERSDSMSPDIWKKPCPTKKEPYPKKVFLGRKTNAVSRAGLSPGWAGCALGWKNHPHRGLQPCPTNSSTLGHSASPEQEAEQINSQEEEATPLRFPDADFTSKRHRPNRGEAPEHRRPQKHRIRHVPECPASAERASIHKLSCQIPLKLQIKVCGQRSGLGISIAGGKGSLPYRESEEGVFISRVSKGGPAEKAGVHVGDRVLEVNGLNMEAVMHYEAVSALRNAGSCITLKVLRERSAPSESAACDGPTASKTDTCVDRLHTNPEDVCKETQAVKTQPVLKLCPAEEIQAIICNGNAANRLDKDRAFKDADMLHKNNTLQVVKNTMTIPRIILTHPSTSDEDVEPLTQDPDEDGLEDFDEEDRHSYTDCMNSAFYPP